MIWESHWWRSDLQKFAASLRKRQEQRRWPDASLARCEQTIMVGFFFVRKLIESRKLSQDFAAREVKVTSFPSRGRHVHLLNFREDPEDLFDMESPRERSLSIGDLSNQLIHSYLFYLSIDEKGLIGILVASDHKRNRELFSLSASAIVEIFELAAKGELGQTLVWNYNDQRKDYVVRTNK